MRIALAVLLCAGTGFAIVTLGWSRRASPAETMLKAFLSAGYGLGTFSVLFVLFRAFVAASLLTTDALVLALLLIGILLIPRPDPIEKALPTADVNLPRWIRNLLTGAFGLAVCAALYCAVRRAIAYPNGEGWDSFAIWNLHARFLFRGGTAWRDGFSPLIPWSHPDYPLLVPGAIAHFWRSLSHETQAVPSIIGLTFTVSTAGVLFSALLVRRGRNVAMLGTLALLSTPLFIEEGTAQYADVPLSFFILATVALVSLGELRRDPSSRNGLMVLAGIGCGFAAWTKNEGLLFLCALLLARFLLALRERSRMRRRSDTPAPRTSFALLFLSAVPVLLLIIWFKHFVAPPGDLFSNTATIFPKLLDPSRYWPIVKWYARQFFRFGHWLWIPGTVLLVGLWAVLRADSSGDATNSEDRHWEPGFRACVIALGLTLAGYFLIYVITPYDVYWHLRFSLNRLFLQLWPSAIFVCALRIATSS